MLLQERDGGNVALAPGDGEVWSALASESLTYLHAADVRFTKGETMQGGFRSGVEV